VLGELEQGVRNVDRLFAVDLGVDEAVSLFIVLDLALEVGKRYLKRNREDVVFEEHHDGPGFDIRANSNLARQRDQRPIGRRNLRAVAVPFLPGDRGVNDDRPAAVVSSHREAQPAAVDGLADALLVYAERTSEAAQRLWACGL